MSAETDDTSRDDEANFSHALVRPLPAEPLLDAFSRVLEAPVKFDGFPLGLRAGELPDAQVGPRGVLPGAGPRFLKAFGKPDRLLSCECERSDDTTLNQAFQLITGELVNGMLTEKDNRLGKLLASGKSDREVVEELYLAALCRPPSPREAEAAAGMLGRAKEATRCGKYTYIEYARFADDLVILIDAYPRHDWLMGAVEKRLREELADLQVEINEEKSRIVDLGRSESFGFLGFDFRRIRSRRGAWCANYTPKLKKRTALLRKLKCTKP